MLSAKIKAKDFRRIDVIRKLEIITTIRHNIYPTFTLLYIWGPSCPHVSSEPPRGGKCETVRYCPFVPERNRYPGRGSIRVKRNRFAFLTNKKLILFLLYFVKNITQFLLIKEKNKIPKTVCPYHRQ